MPESVCSPECAVGYAKTPEGIHRCCFTCAICKNGTYLNITGKTEMPYYPHILVYMLDLMYFLNVLTLSLSEQNFKCKTYDLIYFLYIEC